MILHKLTKEAVAFFALCKFLNQGPLIALVSIYFAECISNIFYLYQLYLLYISEQNLYKLKGSVSDIIIIYTPPSSVFVFFSVFASLPLPPGRTPRSSTHSLCHSPVHARLPLTLTSVPEAVFYHVLTSLPALPAPFIFIPQFVSLDYRTYAHCSLLMFTSLSLALPTLFAHPKSFVLSARLCYMSVSFSLILICLILLSPCSLMEQFMFKFTCSSSHIIFIKTCVFTPVFLSILSIPITEGFFYFIFQTLLLGSTFLFFQF